ncbi:MAG: trehalose utilization protein ThuA [Ruminococcaceae bacterium]|nr:trehalose utilization protein ThuA [Oscillospiraceae bacterium]
MIRVLVWNEFCHEKKSDTVRAIYPNGIHRAIADFLACDDIEVRTATLDEEHCGITKELLAETDVLIWWGHMRHGDVPDDVAEMVRDAVHSGMGAIFLHSAHHSKPFKLLMGTPCSLTWRESGDSELVWVTEPAHPIVRGIDRAIFLPHEETYGEPFSIPNPDRVLLLGSYSGGEAFRAGCLFSRGNGNIFYFQPGHEEFPTYHIPEVQTVIRNAVRFLAPTYREEIRCPHVRHFGDPEGYVIKK